MNATLNGKWHYRSFRHEPIVVKDGQVHGNPELAIPWSPPGVLDVSTSEAGEVTGKLTFAAAPGLVLKVSGKIVPATDRCPASVELTGEAGPSVNKIKGFFIPESDHVVGTIMSVANDLLKQPSHLCGPRRGGNYYPGQKEFQNAFSYRRYSHQVACSWRGLLLFRSAANR